MRVSSISSPYGCSRGILGEIKKQDFKISNPVPNEPKEHFALEKIDNNYLQISFQGVKVVIVDGGNHSTNLAHFAKAISKHIDPVIKEVKVLPEHPTIKYLDDLTKTLKQVNEARISEDIKYIAIPASANVPLLNLQDQVNAVMKVDIELNPENIKTYKPLILEFFKKLHENPYSYSRYIKYMDDTQQGFQYIYPAIQEINKLAKVAKVYIPSGHPFDQTMKWMADENDLKPELYNYIATGKDTDGLIQKMQRDIKNRNWYNFNLLSLSEAKIVTIKNKGNNKDYIFAGYDTCTTHGERGVYNFSPVRDKDNNVLGYSYTNETSVEYPYDEFPANDEIANLVQYVGRKLSDVLATPKETKQFINGEHNEKLNSRLYKVADIFTPDEIKAQKMNLRGDYIDSTKTLFFRENELGKVIFPYTDCEGSGKPSVLPMWGCCFSVINAIKRDIDYEKRAPILFEHYGNYGAYLDKKERVMSGILNKAREAKKWGNYREAEARYNEAIEASKISEKYGDPDITPYLELGDMFLDLKEYRKASGCLNTAMFYLCKKLAFSLEGTTSSQTIADVKQNKANLNIYKNYLNELRDYYKQNSFIRFFTTKPTTYIATDRNSISNYEHSVKLYNDIQEIAEVYKKIGITCENNNEIDSAKKCYRASKEIANCTELGNKLILRRADHNRYIGDLIK